MNIFENWKWRSLWLKGKSKVWCCSNVLNGSESESVISKQEVDPMFQVKVWYQNKRSFQGVPRWSKGAKLRETIGRRGVHPLIIRGPATQSLHRCTPYNIYTNYEVFSDFSCCWKKTLQIYVIAQCPCRRPHVYSSASRQCPPKLGNFPLKIVTSLFPLSFTHLGNCTQSLFNIHHPSKILKSLLSHSSRKSEIFEENEL